MAESELKGNLNLASRVAEIANKLSADSKYTQQRLLDAMDIVLAHGVSLDHRTVLSGVVTYWVDKESGCNCADAKHRTQYCKHFIALKIAQELENTGGYEMPNDTPQDKWEADVQNPETEDAGDDIPELFAVPQKVETEPKDDFYAVPTPQYKDYPSTLSIRRTIGHTEVHWTFRDTDDNSAWQRAAAMIKKLSQYDVPPPTGSPVAAPAPPAPSGPPQPKATNHGPTADSPYCSEHGVKTDKWSKGDRVWFAHKKADGGFCNAKPIR